MEQKYNTNLASEFYVMSMLYRKGLDAYLTLGNKKGVDILVKRIDGSVFNIEVKGVNKKSDDWLLSTGELSDSSDLYFFLISYESEIANLIISPKVWIIPAIVVKEKCYKSPTKSGGFLKYLSHKSIREDFSEYENNWKLLER